MTKMASNELGTESLTKLLWRYALPAIVAMSAASIYNIIDSVFIGHGVGPLAISALAICLPLMNLSAAFGALMGIGASSLLSIRMGQNDFDSAKRILGNMTMMNIITGIIFAILCLAFLDPILYLFGASENTIDYARDFMQIILIGNIITHIYLGLNRVIQASGHPLKSMVIMLISIGVNLVLCPIFIFWLDMGMKGAALATVIAQAVALIIEIEHFTNKKSNLRFSLPSFKLDKRIVSGITSIGLAPFLMHVSASVIVILINNALKTTGGDLYIGAYGMLNRVAMLFLMFVIGFNQGMQPIIGYNFGAGNHKRVETTLKRGIIVAVTITTIGFLISQLFPRGLTMLFTTDPELLDITERAMRIGFLAFAVVGFQSVTSAFFQSIGNAKMAIFISLTRQVILLIPMLIILPRYYGSDGVWISMPISDFLSAILALVILIRYMKKYRETATI